MSQRILKVILALLILSNLHSCYRVAQIDAYLMEVVGTREVNGVLMPLNRADALSGVLDVVLKTPPPKKAE